MKTSLSDMYLIIVLPVAMISMVVTHLRENCILKRSVKINEVAQSCLTLCNPLDCSPPGSSINGIFPGKSTRVGCHFLFWGIFPTQGWNSDLLCCRQMLYHLNHQGSPLTRLLLLISWIVLPQEYCQAGSKVEADSEENHI